MLVLLTCSYVTRRCQINGSVPDIAGEFIHHEVASLIPPKNIYFFCTPAMSRRETGFSGAIGACSWTRRRERWQPVTNLCQRRPQCPPRRGERNGCGLSAVFRFRTPDDRPARVLRDQPSEQRKLPGAIFSTLAQSGPATVAEHAVTFLSDQDAAASAR